MVNRSSNYSIIQWFWSRVDNSLIYIYIYIHINIVTGSKISRSCRCCFYNCNHNMWTSLVAYFNYFDRIHFDSSQGFYNLPHRVSMIPWPSSRHKNRTIVENAAIDKELKFLRNQTGQLKRLLEKQGGELWEQRQLLQSLLDAIKVQRDMSTAEPMYASCVQYRVGHRFLNVNVLS